MSHSGFRNIFVFSLFLISFLRAAPTDALEIRRTVLPNGMTVLHVERHSLPIVMATLLVKAGPFDELAEKAGLANLTAKLLTEGTEKRKAADISEEIEFIGASLNVSVNSDYTLVHLSVLKKDVEKGFEIFSDILLHALFPDEEVSRNKDLIKGSLRQSEEEPSFIAERAFRKAVFDDLPYGRIPSGSVETIDRITRDDIKGFYSAFYKPSNAILSIVGDINDEELKSLTGRFLSSWRPAEVKKPQYDHNASGKKRTILIERDLTQANVIIGHEGIRREDPDYYAVSVMNYILGGGGFSSRLMQSVRDEMGLAYDIHSFFTPHKEAGLFQVGFQTKNESAKDVIFEISRQIERMREEPVSDQELEDAKAYLTGSFPLRLETSRKTADFLAAIEFYGLGLDYVEKYPGYIRSISKEGVLRAARKHLDPGRLVTVMVGRLSKTGITEGDTK
jgi:zinc protease